MKFALLTLFAALLLLGCATHQGKSDIAAFRAFFSGKSVVTGQEVARAFGSPARYAPLHHFEGSERATPGTSWWVYNLPDKAVVSVGIENAVVVAVMYQRPNRPAEFLFQMKPNKAPATVSSKQGKR